MTRNNFTHTRWRGLIRGGPGLAPLFSLGLVLVLCLMPVIGEAADWDVKSSYADDTKCKTDTDPARQCKTIGAAIGEASAGDTITISAGTYTENLTIDKDFGKLTIVGEGSVIIDGGEKNNVFTINSGTDVIIKNVTITKSAANKSGIYNNGGTLEVINSTITGNGKGINNKGTLTVKNTTITGNSGNGIHNYRKTVKLTNCTITDNKGYGIYGIGNSSNPATVTLENCTITKNTKAGIYSDLNATTTFKNTIIVENTKDCDYEEGTTNGKNTSEGYNLLLSTNATCTAITSDVAVDSFGLEDLGNNGGPTETIALESGSPAINAGEPNFTSPPDFDQRGEDFARIVGKTIDIGAYEYRPPLPLANTGLTLDEGATATISTSELEYSYPSDKANELTFKVTDAPDNGDLKNDGTKLNKNDTFTQANIDGNQLKYTHDGSETTSYSFAFTVSNSFDETITDQTFSITVTAVDDPLEIIAPENLGTGINTGLTFSSNLSIKDDDETGSITVELTATKGTLTLSGTSGLTNDTDGSDGSMNFTGTIAKINTALNGMTFTPEQDYAGTEAKIDIKVGTETKTIEITISSVTLTIFRNGTGNGTVSGSGINCGIEGTDCVKDFNNGTSITLTTIPASGSNFAGWSGGCSDTTFTINGDMNCTATFNIPAPPPPPP
ncbi:MAG: hypothetical protein DRQ57_18880, partial [Gammaproteobacteria bacterium]